MSFWRRMFSADFRRAIAAEAAGDYAEAARGYALSGSRIKVAEMHFLRAQAAPSAEGKLTELRASTRWVDAEGRRHGAAGEEARALRRKIAGALFDWARESAVRGEVERAAVKEAAQLFDGAQDSANAGECYEYLGDTAAAADAYERAGAIDRMEQILERTESLRRSRADLSECYRTFQLHWSSGERDRALEVISAFLDEAANSADIAAEVQGIRAEVALLTPKILSYGKVLLRASGREILYVGNGTVTLGREPICALTLRDVGISRTHLELSLSASPPQVRELGSKNGSQLNGLPLVGEAPLPERGTVSLGEHCEIAFERQGSCWMLTVTRGLDRGLTARISSSSLDLIGGLKLHFERGRPILSAADGKQILLNGVRAAGSVQLISGDVIERAGERVEVG